MKHKLKNNVPVGQFSHYTRVLTVQIIFYYIVLTYNVQVILEILIEKKSVSNSFGVHLRGKRKYLFLCSLMTSPYLR